MRWRVVERKYANMKSTPHTAYADTSRMKRVLKSQVLRARPVSSSQIR